MGYVPLFMMLIFSAAAVLVLFCGISAIRSVFEHSGNGVIIVPVFSNADNAEYMIRRTVRLAERSYSGYRIILIDMGADEETLKVCRILADEYGFDIIKADML